MSIPLLDMTPSAYARLTRDAARLGRFPCCALCVHYAAKTDYRGYCMRLQKALLEWLSAIRSLRPSDYRVSARAVCRHFKANYSKGSVQETGK